MVAKTYSAIPQATSSTLIEVEVNISSSEEGNIIIVGLPDTAAKEARDRVKPALYNSSLCQQKQIGLITVNLAPADIRKEGSSFDLAIAIAILAYSGDISDDDICLHSLTYIPAVAESHPVGILSCHPSYALLKRHYVHIAYIMGEEAYSSMD